MSDGFRLERDTMGEMQVPADALYGASTQRAVENFPISSLRLTRPMIRAFGLIKWAAARANEEMGQLPGEQAQAIQKAAEQVAEGQYDSHFPVDVFQTGSGTSSNMNANEVIARLATQAGVSTHPNDHVNKGQSSNDVFPTAMHIAAAEITHTTLLPALSVLRDGLQAKANEFHDVLKIGRTHLQDAVPMRLGQEFGGYAAQVDQSIQRLQAALDGIYELPLGGTAIGTGLNAPKGFAPRAIAHLSERTGIPFREAANHFAAQGARDAVCYFSGALRTCAVALTKIANDIRWLGSGPRCGLGELRLPAVQPGSSIMPGKVNPVIAESLLMVCAQVIGHDATITWCCANGNFELNVMMPVMGHDLLDSIELLAAASRNFYNNCVACLEADKARAESLIEQSLAMCTALVPAIGYEKSAALAKEAYATGRTVREVAREKAGLSEEELTRLLDATGQADATVEGVIAGG